MISKFSVFLMVFSFLFYFSAFGETKEISDNIDRELSNIQIDGFDITEFKNEIMLSGKIPKADTIFKKITEIVFDEAYLSFKKLVILLVPIMLMGVLNSLSVKKGGTAELAGACCYCAICTSLIYIFSDIAFLARQTVVNIDVITKCLIPVLYSLMLTMGNITSAVAMQPTVIFLSEILLVIINKYLFPATVLSFALTVTDNITNGSGLKYFSELITKAVRWSVVFILTIFTTILSAQNILGKSFDRVAVKGIKFAVTNFIPIIGGALSEGVETVGASLGLIKNATGIAGLTGVVVITLMPIIKIYSVCIMFYILSSISQPVCGERFSGVLNSAGNTISTMGVLVICMAFIFIIATALIIGGIV